MPLPKGTNITLDNKKSSIPLNNNTIINEEIVYSDKVLPLKNNGEYLKVKTIYDVKESDLDKCIKIILDNNKDIVFNTIQYTKNNTLYFYTDREISTEEWEDSKVYISNPINNKEEIIKEIKRVLNGEEDTIDENSICKPKKVKSPNSISLYRLYKVIEQEYHGSQNVKKKYQNYIDGILERNGSSSRGCVVYDFDYKKRHLRIGFKEFSRGDYRTTCFTKKDSDLYIAETEDRIYAPKYLAECGDILSTLYDEFLKYEAYERETIYGIKPLNSSFAINLSKHGITILDKEDTWNENFELNAYVWKNEYDYKCNSHQIISELKGKEYIFLNNVYVNIGDCPVYLQEKLYKARKDELDIEERMEQERIKKEQLLEEERIEKERKQTKRLELKRKIFPWLK